MSYRIDICLGATVLDIFADRKVEMETHADVTNFMLRLLSAEDPATVTPSCRSFEFGRGGTGLVMQVQILKWAGDGTSGDYRVMPEDEWLHLCDVLGASRFKVRRLGNGG